VPGALMSQACIWSWKIDRSRLRLAQNHLGPKTAKQVEGFALTIVDQEWE